MTASVATVADALDVQVVRQFSGGAFGAFHVRTAAGNSAVLKLLPNWPEYELHRVVAAADIVHGLEADGYPAPRFLDVGSVAGTVYSMQEYVAAKVPQQLPDSASTTLLALYRRHEAALPDGSGAGWGTELIGRIHRIDELRQRTDDKRIRRIIDRVLEAAETGDPNVFRTNDVVHGDFHPGNVLARSGRVVAIIDWESAQPGDCRADLIRMYAAMATWSHPGSTLFRTELDRTTPPQVRRPIAAELIALHLRYALFAEPGALDWALREAELLLDRDRWL